MNNHDACEQAYKNGYEKGYEAGLKAASEKQIPKKPRKYKANVSLFYFECPNCAMKIQADVKYCRYCGQALDWSDNK